MVFAAVARASARGMSLARPIVRLMFWPFTLSWIMNVREVVPTITRKPTSSVSLTAYWPVWVRGIRRTAASVNRSRRLPCIRLSPGR